MITFELHLLKMKAALLVRSSLTPITTQCCIESQPLSTKASMLSKRPVVSTIGNQNCHVTPGYKLDQR